MAALIRNPEALEARTYDVAIVGGGIQGLAVAWEAALRGLSVALVEQRDFGGGASQGAFKIIHGGLRYLQQLDFIRLRESALEQRFFRKAATHLVRPMPFLVPCYGYGSRSRELLSFVLWLYERLAADRNTGVPDQARLPNFRVLSTEEALAMAPHLQQRGLRGAVLFHDCQMVNCDRVTLLFAKAAAEAGATIVNYIKAESFTLGDGRVQALRVHDLESGKHYSLCASQYVNAAGAWINRILPNGVPEVRPAAFSKGIQLVLDRQISDVAISVESSFADPTAKLARGGRNYFAVPWSGKTLIGTADRNYHGDPSDYSFSEEEVGDFLAEFCALYPAPELKQSILTRAFGGLRPTKITIKDTHSTSSDDYLTVAREDLVISHKEDGLSNLFSVSNVKYTTARAVAARAVYLLTGNKQPHSTHERCFSQCVSNVAKALEALQARFETGFDSHTIERLLVEFGTEAELILKAAEKEPALSALFGQGITAAEVSYCLEQEMVVHLVDVMYRRTSFAAAGLPEWSEVERLAKFVAKRLSWSEERLQHELTLVRGEANKTSDRNFTAHPLKNEVKAARQ